MKARQRSTSMACSSSDSQFFSQTAPGARETASRVRGSPDSRLDTSSLSCQDSRRHPNLMHPTDRLARQMAFLVECDRLKEIVRQTLNTHSGRQENDAEHSWALCLFVMTLAEHSNQPIDVLRVMKMLLIHDVVEIDAGDTFAYDTTRLADQHDREAPAATRIFG